MASGPAGRDSGRRRRNRSSGLFVDVTVRRYAWQTRYTAEQYIAFLNTFFRPLLDGPTEPEQLYPEIREWIACAQTDGRLTPLARNPPRRTPQRAAQVAA
jgi:hypothetical protein